MASLPSQHPHLALHLTDRALTPIISSSSSTITLSSKPYSSKQQQQQYQQHSKRSSHPKPTFSTSPPSSGDDSEDDDDDDDSEEEGQGEQSGKSQALSHLTFAALASYDAAKRLERGAPLRTMVEYPGPDGPVVLHSYMCPMSLALGVPGRKGSNESLRTGAGGALPASSEEDGEGGGGGGGGSSGGGGSTESGAAAKSSNDNGEAPPTNNLSKLALQDLRDTDSDDGDDHVDGTDGSQDNPNAPPMLIGTVVARKADDLRDARRAAGRLERVARVFQTEWLTVEGTGDAGAGI